MKTIKLNKSTLTLPTTWEDLTFKQKIFAFERLKLVYKNKLSPAVFRLQVLQNLTGYTPKTGMFPFLGKLALYNLAKPFASAYYRAKIDKKRFKEFWQAWKEYHRPKKYDRDIINFNLFRLSEQIDFAFTIQDYKVAWNRSFARNPFPYLKIKGRKFIGKKFFMDVAPFTNITAREFSDCFDLYSAYTYKTDDDTKEKILDKIISILYPATRNYNENLVSSHIELISNINPGIKFGILFWFSGIVEYYMTHPYYSILFRNAKSTDDDEDKITLGMNEVVLMIKRKGYDSNDNINDFFDAQLKLLKDNLFEAVASGIKKEELSNKTGLSITDINKLT